MEQQPKRGRGRPPKQSEVKRTFFQTRMRESQRRRLEAAAAENGRSLSEEIELRLELSLRDDDLGRVVFGDTERFGLLAALDRLILAVQMKTAKSIEDRETRHLAADSISGFLKGVLETVPALMAGRPASATDARALADSYALQALAALRGQPAVKPADPQAAEAAADEAAAAAAEFVKRFPDHPFSRLAKMGKTEKPTGEAA
jgi:AT hook motif